MANTRTVTVSQNETGQFQAQGAFAISFYRPNTNPNNGNASNPVTVDSIPIESGSSLNIRQNVGDKDYTQYQIVFKGGAGEDILYIIQVLES